MQDNSTTSFENLLSRLKVNARLHVYLKRKSIIFWNSWRTESVAWDETYMETLCL